MSRSVLPAMQVSASGQPQLEYSYYPGVDHPHAVRQSSTDQVFYYITNNTGSVVALVNKANQVVNQYQYTPFGEAIAVSEQVAQPLRFAAREFDTETGLYYNRARYYDPTLARFISEDPIGLAGGVNPYAYAENNPIDYRDPSGLNGCSAAVEGKGWETVTIDGHKWCRQVQQLEAVHVTDTYSSGLNFGLSLISNRGNGASSFYRGGSGAGGGGGRGVIGRAVATMKNYVCSQVSGWSLPVGGYYGLSASYFIVYGFTGGIGVYSDSRGPGVYARIGGGIGLQGAAGTEAGFGAGSMSGIAGELEGATGSHSTTISASTSGISGSTGQKISSMPISGHAAVTYTGTKSLKDVCGQ